MTTQEFFTLCEFKSLEGSFPSSSVDFVGRFNGCWYRSKEAKACPVGLIIPNEVYNEDMEGGSAFELFKRYPELKQYIPEGMDIRDLDEIQTIHDDLAKDIIGKVYDSWPHEEFMEQLGTLQCFKN